VQFSAAILTADQMMHRATNGFFISATARQWVYLLIPLMLSACASMSPNYEEPVVSLTYFRPAESGSGFDVGLKVLNPNREPLELQGVVYTIRVQGQDVIKGVGKGYAPIEGYGEGDIELSAAPNLIAGIRLLSELMNQASSAEAASALDFEFEAKLDVGGLYPRIKVQESGSFKLGPQPQ
jgi:LEA14-like dessication related protein